MNIENIPRICIVCKINYVKTPLKTPICTECRHMDAHPNDLEAQKRFNEKKINYKESAK